MSLAEGGAGGGSHFAPKEDLLKALMDMGVSKNAATKALYYTGNSNADLAAAWIFENQDRDLESPLVVPEDSDDEDEIEDFLQEGDFFKMVFVVNSQHDMGVGKIAAQVAHAALELYRQMADDQQKYGEMLLQWEQFGETKIVLKGTNTQQLVELAGKASSLDLPHYVVQDAGKTQVAAGSMTVLGIMGKVSTVDQVTGDLGLLL